MNTLTRISLLFVACLSVMFGQTALTQTTLSAAALATDSTLTVTSATGINAPAPNTVGTQLYVIAPGAQRGEVMPVQAVSSTTITVARNRQGVRSAFPSGSRVVIGTANQFYSYSPSGGCTAASTAVTPWINTKDGTEWLCSTVTLSWVPGFNNPTAPIAPTAAVASAAGSIIPSGPMFHVTGTAAVTGFTLASMTGFNFSGCFVIVPDGAFTWTNAGNIAVAGTAVVSRSLTFCYDINSGKFYPSYV